MYALLLDIYTKLLIMNRFIKYFGLLLIVAGVPTVLLDLSPGSDIPLLVGLFLLFISKERREDERAVTVKTSSAYIALVLSYGIKLLSTNLYSHDIISLQLTEINHFLIMVFAIALILYYTRMFIVFK